jgi:uncharacterized membrane protein YhaH (DUF805 family)
MLVGLAGGAWAAEIVGLIFYFPQFAIATKRAHDRNIPTWMVAVIFAFGVISSLFSAFGLNGDNFNVYSLPNLVLFAIAIPFAAASLALFIQLGFLKGTAGPNQFGPDPNAASVT